MEAMSQYLDEDQAEAGVPENQRILLRTASEAGPAKQVSPAREDAVAAAVFSGVLGWGLAYVLLQIVTAGRRIR